MGQIDCISCSAFNGKTRIATGQLREVAQQVKAVSDRDHTAQILIFDDRTSELIELDLRGTADDVLARIPVTTPPPLDGPVAGEIRRPGRPRLGVVAREVTLLPRHWEWLASQPGGASVALRRLVEHARVSNRGKDRRRVAKEAAYRFLSAMGGNEAGFEEATRALFADKPERFHEMVETWPKDVRDHARNLAAVAFAADEEG